MKKESTVSYSEYKKAIINLQKKLVKRTCWEDANRFVWFTNLGGDRNIQLGLHIVGSGNISTIVAKRVVYAVEVAAELAEGFKYNGYSIIGG